MTKRSQLRLTPLNEEIKRVEAKMYKEGTDNFIESYLQGLYMAKMLVKNEKEDSQKEG